MVFFAHWLLVSAWLEGHPIRLYFKLTRARLYAFQFLQE